MRSSQLMAWTPLDFVGLNISLNVIRLDVFMVGSWGDEYRRVESYFEEQLIFRFGEMAILVSVLSRGSIVEMMSSVQRELWSFFVRFVRYFKGLVVYGGLSWNL